MLARVVGVPVGQRSGGPLATPLVVTLNIIFFQFFISPPRLFLLEGVLGSKTYLAKVDGIAQKPRGTLLSIPFGFWRLLYRRNDRIKKLI